MINDDKIMMNLIFYSRKSGAQFEDATYSPKGILAYNLYYQNNVKFIDFVNDSYVVIMCASSTICIQD